MEHLLLKAAVSAATDQGVFEAVVSTATIDRERDIVDPDGMVAALQKWTQTGKNIPLAWNHSTASADQIGYIDPASARNVNGEVVVKGWIDQSTPVGADAWRLVKMGTLGFSFGYLVPDGGSVKRAGGGEHIRQLDVFEVTASPTPMNNDTRVLSFKAAVAAGDLGARILNSMIGQAQEFIDGENDPEDVDAMNEILDALQDLADVENGEGDEPDDMPMKAVFSRAEFAAAKAGELKAAWTAAYVDSLPDSSFLYVEPGGEKDSDGRTTPRSLRHFPVKDADGKPDLPHVRNALARIPQSSLPQAVKDRATAAAQRMLDETSKSVPDQATRSHADPLRKKDDRIELEFASGGESLRKATPAPEPKRAEPRLPLKELRQRMRDEMLTALSGIEEP